MQDDVEPGPVASDTIEVSVTDAHPASSSYVYGFVAGTADCHSGNAADLT